MTNKIGDVMVRDGRVWRLYEIELEGYKWEDIGPKEVQTVHGLRLVPHPLFSDNEWEALKRMEAVIVGFDLYGANND